MYRIHGVIRNTSGFVKSRMFNNKAAAEDELDRLKTLQLVGLCSNGDYAAISTLFQYLVIEESIGDISGIDNTEKWEKLTEFLGVKNDA